MDRRAEPGRADGRMEAVVGTLLRLGVLGSALVVLAGAGVYLARHDDAPTDLHAFHGEPAEFTNPRLIVSKAAEPSGRGLIQLGLLLLIATPVARVAVTVFAFLFRRDWVYVAVTLFVLAVLLFSLAHGFD